MKSNIIKIVVDHEAITATSEWPLVSGAVGDVEYLAVFDPSWEGYETKLVFTACTMQGTVVREIIGTQGQVPWEVLEVPGTLYISAVGVAEGKQRPTAVMRQGIPIQCSGALGGEPGEPTPDFENQVLHLVRKAEGAAAAAKKAAQEAVEAAGTPGPQGPAGHTPVKGEDYFTEADRQELVQDVLAALPRAEEVAF